MRGGDEVDVTCASACRDGKMFRIFQEYRRPDGTLIAELYTVGGLLDLAERRLLPDVRERFRSLASSGEPRQRCPGVQPGV
jgi:acyl-CoA thioester hydrolase